MRYVRTKDGRIIPAGTATHELTQAICDAGYFKILDKGSYVTIGEEWTNFYGRWVDIIDENGSHYSVRPSKVKEVTRELPQADTIEELCDEFVYDYVGYDSKIYHAYCTYNKNLNQWEDVALLFPLALEQVKTIKGAIWTEWGLKYVAKMNSKGEFELL